MHNQIKSFYKNHYKKLLVLSVGIAVISLFMIFLTYFQTGSFIEKDISLKGGITTTIYTSDTTSNTVLEEYLTEKLNEEVVVRSLTDIMTREHLGFIVEVSEVNEADLKQALKEKITFDDKGYSVEEVGPSLGESFYKQILVAIAAAFVLMAIVIFISFRTPLPSLAVVLSVFSDMIVTLGVADLFNIKIGTGSIAALLLIIGYSVDTNILLTTKVLKRKSEGGDVIDRIFGSVKTGLTMTVAALAALIVGYFLSNSQVISQMFLIIIIGLIYDIFSTYITNASLLMWYCKKKNIQ